MYLQQAWTAAFCSLVSTQQPDLLCMTCGLAGSSSHKISSSLQVFQSINPQTGAGQSCGAAVQPHVAVGSSSGPACKGDERLLELLTVIHL